jgi:hypothetical protein
MKQRLFSAIFALLAILSIVGCATPAVSSPALQARLTPEWIASAQCIQSGNRTIYYRGRAQGATQGDGADWTGTVRGEILALDPAMAIVIPSGTLTLGSKQELQIAGPQQVITSDAPAWKHLLRP